MGNQYYYLGADRTAPKGPHTPEELGGMLLRGELLPTTEVAAVGDTCWQPLGKLLMKHNLPPTAPAAATQPSAVPEANIGNDDLPPVPGSVAGTAAPATAPPPLATAAPGMWACMKLAVARTFCWRGRARRAEFWYSWLLYLLITFVLTITCVFLLAFGDAAGGLHIKWEDLTFGNVLRSEPLLPFWIAVGCYLAWILWMSVVFLTLTARRLHDTGRSGMWVVYCVLCGVIWQIHYFHRVAEIVSSVNWQLVLSIQDKASRDARLEEIIQQINLAGYDGWWGILYLLSLILGIFILIFTLADSEPGENKYGISPKYPQK